MASEKVLLHVCCADCLFDSLRAVEGRDWRLGLLFFNPNIQPLLEYRRRLKSVLLAAERLGLELVREPDVSPSPAEFLCRADWQGAAEERCRSCYRLRLGETASVAVSGGFDAFLSTLQVSGQQRFAGVVSAGREAAERHGVRFVDEDFRGSFHKGETPAGFHPYRQQYCGCIFSEHERFAPTTKHLVKEAGE